jgi:hypothetical protein
VKSRTQKRLRTGDEYLVYSRLESDEDAGERRFRAEETARLRRSELLNGLTRRQRHFLLEKLCGHSDKDAALLAGYSLSVAENTKQRVWKPVVRSEFERLSENLTIRLAAKGLPSLRMVGKC